MRATTSSTTIIAVVLATAATAAGAADGDWQAFELSGIRRQQEHSGRAYLEFLRVAPLSVGLYVLEAGGTDNQPVHDRDEVYHVLAGRAVLTLGEDRRAVRPGSVVYVKAGVEHRFVEIEDDLEVLVFFAAPPPTDGG